MKKAERRNESFDHQMKSLLSSCVLAFTLLISVASARAQGSQTSAHYNFTVESVDLGGLRAYSADYKSDGSISAGGFVKSGDYAQRGGYVGQLNNAPASTNYMFTTTSNINAQIPLVLLLGSATDPDGDFVSFVSVASSTAQGGAAASNGNFVAYAPPSGFTGGDSFTWVMRDSEGDQGTGTILAQVNPPPSLSGLTQYLFFGDDDGQIFKCTPGGGAPKLFATLGNGHNIAGLAFATDASGNLYAADQNAGIIRKFTPAGAVSTFASGLSGPAGVAVDRGGNVFVADEYSGDIYKYTPAGVQSVFATGLSGPIGLTFDAAGNLYAADGFSGGIFKFTPQGVSSLFATEMSTVYSSTGYPQYLAFNSSGSLFSSDLDGNIYKFTPAGAQSTFAASPSQPLGLAFDRAGNLLAADLGTGNIYAFDPGANRSTFASGVNAVSMALQPSVPPGLAIGPINGLASLVVTWPDVGSYHLQTNSDLATSNWGVYGGSITSTNGMNGVIITSRQGNLFFRLSNP
jgi:hypothetical protein